MDSPAGVAEQKVRKRSLLVEVLSDERMDGVGPVGGESVVLYLLDHVPVVNFKNEVNGVVDVDRALQVVLHERCTTILPSTPLRLAFFYLSHPPLCSWTHTVPAFSRPISILHSLSFFAPHYSHPVYQDKAIRHFTLLAQPVFPLWLACPRAILARACVPYFRCPPKGQPSPAPFH